MPIVNGSYRQQTEAEIRNDLEDELRAEFGADIDLTQSSVFSTLTAVLASTLADNQEESIAEVYDAAFLDTATGEDLDNVVSIIGIQRRSAIHSTGVQRFIGVDKADQDYVIQRGTAVQTDGQPIQFETSEVAVMDLVDSFESGNLSDYSGDVGAATVEADGSATDGDNVLTMDATNGAAIYKDDIEQKQGSVYHCDVRPTAGTQPTVIFGMDPFDASNYYQIVVDEAAQETRLEVVEDNTVTSTIDTAATTITANEFHEVEINWSITNNIGITVFDADDNELSTLGGDDDTYTRGYAGFKSNDANGSKSFDWYTTSEVSANIRAIEGGVEGNVGANSIQQLVSPPSNVDRTTNLYPTGDPQYEDRDQNSFAVGTDEETDSELRNRASEAVTGGGDATHDAIVAELTNNVDNVSSVTVYENKTDIDNTGSGGLPPVSFEAVVYGGTDEDVANALFDKKAITARDYGGANGTAVSVTVTADSNGQTREITFSRPTKLDVSMNLDVVIDDSYVGDDDIRDQITQYIGGALSNGSTTIGIGVGEDVRVDKIRDIVIGDDNGVLGFDKSVDGTPIETTPATTTVGGLDVIDVGENEVAQTDASDATITINTRER
jgi:uncharacterized phage protein gp47/JayE